MELTPSKIVMRETVASYHSRTKWSRQPAMKKVTGSEHLLLRQMNCRTRTNRRTE
jgi:hypothetical protein